MAALAIPGWRSRQNRLVLNQPGARARMRTSTSCTKYRLVLCLASIAMKLRSAAPRVSIVGRPTSGPFFDASFSLDPGPTHLHGFTPTWMSTRRAACMCTHTIANQRTHHEAEACPCGRLHASGKRSACAGIGGIKAACKARAHRRTRTHTNEASERLPRWQSCSGHSIVQGCSRSKCCGACGRPVI